MSPSQDLATPPPSPTSATPFPLLEKKSRQDVAKFRRSVSSPPSMFLKVPQAPAGLGLLTPPDTPVKNQYATPPASAKLIDCPISKASFLLAQASLASQLCGLSTTKFKFRVPGSGDEIRTLRFGKGLDGCFNHTRGFLGDQNSQQGVLTTRGRASTRPEQRLPASLEAWEAVHDNLSRLLRSGQVRQAVDALGERAAGGRDPWDDLEQHHLARAALVLSSLAHAYMFGQDQGKCKGAAARDQLPRHVVSKWEKVCAELGRSFTGRVRTDRHPHKSQSANKLTRHDRCPLTIFSTTPRAMALSP